MVLSTLAKMAYNFLGFKTDRKLLIICSDDWGSMRLKDARTREHLKKLGLNLDSNRFDRFDCVETNEDVELLFDVLSSHKDANGNYPVLTALTNVANPDFDKIRNSDYQTFSYQDLTATYRNYPGRDNVLRLFREGIQKRIFIPQFHGREHLQVSPWMKALAANDLKTKRAFDHDFFFLAKQDVQMKNLSGEFAEAFNFWNQDELKLHGDAIRSGTSIFKNLFGYSAEFFTPPVLIYHNELNSVLSECGIAAIDIPKVRYIPRGENKYRRRLSYMGQKNSQGQILVNRNAVFETNMKGVTVDSCLAQISDAFNARKPAIISNHRASFVSGITSDNRDEGLRQLDLLLKAVIKRWPTVEFIDITALIRMIVSNE